MSLASCGASWECGVRVKEEPGLEHGASVKQEEGWEPVKQEPSEAAAAGLYVGHEVKGELALGPTTLQPPDAAFTRPASQRNAEQARSPPAERGHSLAGVPSPEVLRPDQLGLRACSVRLERLSLAENKHAHSTILGVPGERCSAPTVMSTTGRNQSVGCSRESTHTGEKPYKCEICLKQFSYNSDFLNHKRIHTGEKPYKCEFCFKRFSSKGHLSAHRYIHTGEKPYKCEICMKQFAQKSNLVTHQYVHTSEKPFKCEICMKQFSQKSNLVIHKYIHTGEKPFQCDICKKQFSQRGDLRRHDRIHTGVKPYKCRDSPKQFYF